MTPAQQIHDVIIIGGSYAGLSAAMSLGRSLQSVLIIDSGNPCNRQTPHSYNFLTQDGETPAAIARKAKEQVLKYESVTFLNDTAVSGTPKPGGFAITTGSNGQYFSKKLIIATGITDIMPKIKGFAECWGISAIHCPYCHGYEVKGLNTAIIANGERAFHLASLVRNLTDQVTILTSGVPEFSPDQSLKLANHGIRIVDSVITELQHHEGQLHHIGFKNGEFFPFDATYAAVPFRQHSDIPVALGCQLTEHGHIKVDNLQKTSVEGVFACGDSTTMMRSVANAVYSGNLAGAMVNKALVDDEF